MLNAPTGRKPQSIDSESDDGNLTVKVARITRDGGRQAEERNGEKLLEGEGGKLQAVVYAG